MLLAHKHIQEFAAAQLNDQARRITDRYLNIFSKVDLTVYFELPSACFPFDSSLNDENKQVLNSFGMNRSLISPNTYIGTPTLNQLRQIFKMGLTERRTEPGQVTADAYLAYTFLLRGFSIFSALQNNTTKAITAAIFTSQEIRSIDDEGSAYVTVEYTNEEEEDFKFTDCTQKSVHTIDPTDIATAGPYDSSKKIEGAYIDLNMEDLQSRLPTHGLFFPYFDTMVLPDKSIFQHLFPSLFMRCLADDIDSATTLWSRIRSGTRALATSTAGRSLSHLYTGIKLAIESNASIHAILDKGRYKGFVLGGEGLKFRMWGKTYESVPRVGDRSLMRELGEVNRHSKALGELLVLINSPVKEDGMPKYLFGLHDIDTSRKLLETLMAVDRSDYSADVVQEMTILIDELRFEDKYASLTQENLLIFLDYVLTGNRGLLANFPAYLRGGYAFMHSRAAVGLGIFGSYSPTINYGTGSSNVKTFTFPVSSNSPDPNLEQVDGRRHLQYLPFATVPTRQAEAQWNQVFARGSFKIPDGRKRKNEFTDVSLTTFRITTNPFFDRAYNRMRDIATGVKEGVRAGKRKGGRDDEETGESSQRKKAKTSAAALNF